LDVPGFGSVRRDNLGRLDLGKWSKRYKTAEWHPDLLIVEKFRSNFDVSSSERLR
jgi:hypothetical protein